MITSSDLNPLDDDDDVKIDFNSPEDVLIHVIADEIRNTHGDWKGFMIEACTVLSGAEDVMGAASYDHVYGGSLDYTIEGMIDCPGEGHFVVTGITGHYHKGDGWMTDDDMDFYFESVRPATDAEIAQL